MKKEYLIILPIVVLFAFVSLLSFYSINHMQGNARVVNYIGIVRGATQKLIKQELMGYEDDALVERLDSIVNELITGTGPHNLILMNDKVFMGNMAQVKEQWGQLKREITQVRKGADPENLYNMSQDYFTLADRTVSSAEAYSESQVAATKKILTFICLIFVLLLALALAYMLRSIAIKRKADQLGKIAYVDTMTQLPNRAAFGLLAERLRKEPSDGDIAIFMFDMNNLKVVNDELGHKEGDRLITDFARIISEEATEYGEVYRYGGDEFLAVLENTNQLDVQRYLSSINERIVAYNLLSIDPLGKISFAVGMVMESCVESSLENMVNEADKRMYIRKRQMKDNRDCIPSYAIEQGQE